MFTNFKHIDDQWRNQHRRYSEHPSIVHDIVLIAGMISAMVFLLYLF